MGNADFASAERFAAMYMYYATFFPVCQTNGEFLRHKNPILPKMQVKFMLYSHFAPNFHANSS